VRFVVCLTGASGIIYGLRLIDFLSCTGHEVITIYSKAALDVAEAELTTKDIFLKMIRSRSLKVYMEDDATSPLASSSNLVSVEATVIAPCSIRTLSNIANGNAVNLIVRVALNTLRLGKKLVLVPRETPLGYVELRNMLEVVKAGAILVPAMPAFYHNPKDLRGIIDFVVGKVLDVLGIKHDLYRRWGGKVLTQPSYLCVQLFGSECS